MTNNRNIGIDFLRGISILFVVLLHLNIHLNLKESFFGEVLSKKWFNIFFWSGYYGVVIFFTLSGYLITTTILKRWNKLSNINLKHYFWLRFSRIFPTLILLLTILSILHLLHFEPFVIDGERSSLPRALFSALTFHVNWLEMNVGYLPGNWDVLWTISVEEVFYIVFPLLCVLFRKKWMLVTLLIGILIVSPICRTHLFLDNELGDRNNFNYMDCIALGVLVAVLTFNTDHKKIFKNIVGILGSLMVICVIGFRGKLYKAGITELGLDLTILSSGIALLVFWIHYYFSEKDTVILPLSWLSDLGKYSYEIYLSHMFVVALASYISNEFGLNRIWLVFGSIIICYFLGKIVFNYFSNPINQKLRSKWMN